MRIYPQLILWTYVLLPTICILLSPTLILGIVKAQQQRTKLMAKAINTRAKTATALAKNQAKMQQRKFMPNNRFSSGMSQRPFNRRTTRDVEIPMMETTAFSPDMFERKTHWDQQEETMGQLQNMWNMNGFGNMGNMDILRHTETAENNEDMPSFEEKSATPEARYKNKTHGKKSGHHHFRSNENEAEIPPVTSMAFSSEDGVSSFDQKSADADPHGKKKWKGHHHFRSSEHNEAVTDMGETNLARPQEVLGNPRIYSEKRSDDFNRGAFFSRNVYDAVVSQRNPDTHALNPSEIMPPSVIVGDPQPTLKKKKKFSKKMEPNFYYYPPSYYGPYYTAPPYARDVEEKSPFTARQAMEFENDMNDEMMPFVRFANPEPTLKKKKKFKKKMQPNYYYYPPQNYYSSYYPGSLYKRTNDEESQIQTQRAVDFSRQMIEEMADPRILQFQKSKNNANEEMIGAAFGANPNEEMLGTNNPNRMSDGVPTQSTDPNVPNIEDQRSAAHAGHGHSEDVGCELDDLFNKKQDYEAPFKNYNPYSYYQRTVEEVTDLNKKNSAATTDILHTMPHPSATTEPNKPHEQQPGVQYLNSDEHINSKEYSENDNNNVGAIQQASKEKSADPSPNPHYHGGGYAHTHTHYHSHQKTYGKQQGFHSTPVIYGPPHSPPLYPEPHTYSSKAEAHAKAQTFSHGNVQNGVLHTGSKTHGFVPSNTGFGLSETQAAAVANSGTGFGHTAAQAAAQAGTQNLNGGSFAQSAAQASSQSFNTGFGQPTSQAAAQAVSRSQGGPQFFQVLGPSSFINSRSAKEQNNGQSRESGGFAMPHIDDIPVRDTLNNMEAKLDRFPRSKESRPDIFDGLNLASSIVDSSLDRNPLNHQITHQIKANGSPDAERAMSFVSHIVESSLKPEKNINDAAFELKNSESLGAKNILTANGMGLAAINKAKNADSLESSTDLTFQEIATITDLVNKGLRQKRQINGPLITHGPKDILPTSDELLPVLQHEKTNWPKVVKKDEDAKAMKHVKPGLNENTEKITEKAIENPINKHTGENEEMLEMINPDELYTTEHITIEPWASNWDYVNNREKFPHEMEQENKPKLDKTNVKPDLNKNTEKITENSINKHTENNEKMLEINYLDELYTTEHITIEPWASNWDYVNNKEKFPHKMEQQNKPKLDETNVKPNLNKNTEKITEKVTKNPINKHARDNEKMLEMINPDELYTTEHITMEPWAFNWDYVNNREKFPHEMEPQNKPKLDETNEKLDKTESDMHNQTISNTALEMPLEKTALDSKKLPNRKIEDKQDGPLNLRLGQTPSKLSGLKQNDGNIELQKLSTVNNAPEQLEHEKLLQKKMEKEKLGSSKSIIKNESASNEDSSEENGNRNTTTEVILPQVLTSTESNINIPLLTLEEIEDIQFTIPDNNGTESDKKFKLQEGVPDSSLDKVKHDIQYNKMDSSKNISLLITEDQKKSSLAFNTSESPFASIEAEMSALTDEEKDAFIKQEIDLISEVIEETLKHRNINAKIIKNQNESEINAEGMHNETSKGEVLSTPNLFQAFTRARANFERNVRTALPDDQAFDAILGAHKEKLDNIQKEATDDDDLLMISFIGESVIKDLENRRKQAVEDKSTHEDSESPESATKKIKREITGLNPNHVPITRLISDPTTKIDIPKTLENVGAVVRTTLENSQAPMYHVRSMLGNTKNTLMSAAKIAPNNVLLPSKYEIAKLSENKDENQQLGAINREMLASRSGTDNVAKVENSAATEPLDITNTFQQIGGMVKESVNTGKDMVMHVNDAATDARNALYTVKHAAPRLIVPGQIPMVSSRNSFPAVNPIGKKAILLTPRLLEVQENIVGAEEQHPKEFVGMGNIFDAVGFTQPNQKEVELEKIVLEPTAIDVMKQWDRPKELRPFSAVKTWMKDSLKPEENKTHDILGSQQENTEETLKTLREAEKSVGTNNLKDFFNKMRQEMKEILTSQHEERKRKRKEKASKRKPVYTKLKKDRKFTKKKPIRKTVVPIEEPIQKPNAVLRATNTKIDYDKIIDEHATATLPPEISSIFTNHPSTKPNSNQENLKSSTNAKKSSDEDENVGFYLMPELMKPFMGQPSEGELDNFMRENNDDMPAERKSTNDLKTTKIYPITPLNLNVTIPMDGAIAPLNLSYLLPNPPLVGEQIQENLRDDKTTIDEWKQKDKFGASAHLPTQEQSTIKRMNEETNQKANSFSGIHHQDDLGHVLGAMNPLMFEEYFNESLRKNQFGPNNHNGEPNNIVGSTIGLVTGKENDTKDLHIVKSISHPDENRSNDKELTIQNENYRDDVKATGRTSMKIIGQYKKPFMGYMGHDKIHEYLNQYNNNLPENGDEPDDFTPQENIAPVNKVVFSEDDDYNLSL